jgi:hypothetical protein
MSIDREKYLRRWVLMKKAVQDQDLSPEARAQAKKVRDLAFVALGLDSAQKKMTRH